MGEELTTLIDRLREALTLHPDELAKFFSGLSEREQRQLEEIMILAEALRLRTRGGIGKNFEDPVAQLTTEFSNLVFRAQTRLTPYGKEEIFGKWIDVLIQKYRSRKDAVMLRYCMEWRPGNTKAFTRKIAQENEAYPPEKRAGWTSTDAETLRTMIYAEFRKLGQEEEPPSHLTLVKE